MVLKFKRSVAGLTFSYRAGWEGEVPDGLAKGFINAGLAIPAIVDSRNVIDRFLEFETATLVKDEEIAVVVPPKHKQNSRKGRKRG